MLDIRDSVAVITGASGGIGRALARYWSANGGKLVLADISGEQLAVAAGELKASGADVHTLVCDVRKEEDTSALAELAIKTYGGINLVAPFAGIIRDGMVVSADKATGKAIGKMSLSDFQLVMDINVTGVFLTVRDCLEQMVNHGSRGLICLVSSTGSLGTAGQINYSSSKAAMSVFPRVITAELFRRGLSERIRCMTVAPGYVGTEMVKGMNQAALSKILEQVPIGRLVEPEEVASLVGEIFRNEAIAGDTFFIHGGLRLGSKG